MLISGFVVYNKCVYWTSKEPGIEIYKGIYTERIGDLATVEPYANGYEYLEEYNNPALVKFMCYVRLRKKEDGYSPLFCSLNENKTMTIVTAQTVDASYFLPEAKVAFSDRDFMVVNVTITESEFKEIMNCVKNITSICDSTNNNEVHRINGGVYVAIYYKNQYFDLDFCEIGEPRKAMGGIFRKMYEVASKYCDINKEAMIN